MQVGRMSEVAAVCRAASNCTRAGRSTRCQGTPDMRCHQQQAQGSLVAPDQIWALPSTALIAQTQSSDWRRPLR